jgi:hypothetical protein
MLEMRKSRGVFARMLEGICRFADFGLFERAILKRILGLDWRKHCVYLANIASD